jgi:hypothetical protein
LSLFKPVEFESDTYLAAYYESQLPLYILVEGTIWQFLSAYSDEIAKVSID